MKTKPTMNLLQRYTIPDLLQYGFGHKENLARYVRPVDTLSHAQWAPQASGNRGTVYSHLQHTKSKHRFANIKHFVALTPNFLLYFFTD